MKTQESKFKFYLNFILKLLSPALIGFIVNQLQNFKNFRIIKIRNKYVEID
jgi:hypothetical protein